MVKSTLALNSMDRKTKIRTVIQDCLSHGGDIYAALQSFSDEVDSVARYQGKLEMRDFINATLIPYFHRIEAVNDEVITISAVVASAGYGDVSRRIVADCVLKMGERLAQLDQAIRELEARSGMADPNFDRGLFITFYDAASNFAHGVDLDGSELRALLTANPNIRIARYIQWRDEDGPGRSDSVVAWLTRRVTEMRNQNAKPGYKYIYWQIRKELDQAKDNKSLVYPLDGAMTLLTGMSEQDGIDYLRTRYQEGKRNKRK